MLSFFTSEHRYLSRVFSYSALISCLYFYRLYYAVLVVILFTAGYLSSVVAFALLPLA